MEYEKAIAKYLQALAFQDLGDKTNTRNLFKRVIEKYPHSDQAQLAKKKLEGIK